MGRISKLDLEKIAKAKDKQILKKATEFKKITDEIAIIKAKYLDDLTDKQGELKREIIELFKGIEERTRKFEDFTMKVVDDSLVRQVAYQKVVAGLHEKYSATVKGFDKTLEKLTEEYTTIVPRSGSVSLGYKTAIKEGWLSDMVDKIKKVLLNLKDSIMKMMVNEIDDHMEDMEEYFRTEMSYSNISDLMTAEQKKKYNIKESNIKISKLIKLIEAKTGKDVVLIKNNKK